jgi:hypothetical protein
MTDKHPTIGLTADLAKALGVAPVELRVLMNTAGVPFRSIESIETFSRRHLINAFRSGLVKAGTDDPNSVVRTKYSLEEAGELYRASLPSDGSVPF